MMGPAGFLIAILGCGEADAPCEQVALAPARYQTEASCMAATEMQLARHADAPFPVVVAECRAAGAQVATLNADEVRRPAPRGAVAVQTAER